jgi:hypothetical protein
VLDPRSPAGALVPDLIAAGVEPVEVNGTEHAQACGMFFEAATGGWLRHIGQPNLAAALDGATKRPLGDAWAWNRVGSSVDISPLVAVTLALRALNTLKRDPSPGVVLLDDYLDDDE